MGYEEWMKFGAVRGMIGVLLAAFTILLMTAEALDLTKVIIGGIIAIVLVAGLYGLYAYLLGETLAENRIVGWKALAVIAMLVGLTSAVIVLAVSYEPADISSPGTAVAYSYEFTQPKVNATLASAGAYTTLSIESPGKDVVTVIVSSVIGEILTAFFVAGLYRTFGAKLPEVA